MQLTVLKSLDAVIQACCFHQFPVNRSRKKIIIHIGCHKDLSKICVLLSLAFMLAIIRTLTVATAATFPSILLTEMLVYKKAKVHRLINHTKHITM